jgi:hypothetical protein
MNKELKSYLEGIFLGTLLGGTIMYILCHYGIIW